MSEALDKFAAEILDSDEQLVWRSYQRFLKVVKADPTIIIDNVTVTAAVLTLAKMRVRY